MLNFFRAASFRRMLLLACMTALVDGCGVFSQEQAFDQPLKPSGLRLIYPAGSIVNAALAEQALRAAEEARIAIAARYRSDELPCYDRFFVTRCVDAGRERRRIALAEVRSVEVEADYIQRRERADQRDREIQERIAQEKADAPQRQKVAEKTQQEAAAKAAQRAADESQRLAQPASATPDVQARERKHAANLSKKLAADAAEQPQRAANVAAFEKRQAQSQARVKQIAEEKAKKAAEAKQAAEAAQQK